MPLFVSCLSETPSLPLLIEAEIAFDPLQEFLLDEFGVNYTFNLDTIYDSNTVQGSCMTNDAFSFALVENLGEVINYKFSIEIEEQNYRYMEINVDPVTMEVTTLDEGFYYYYNKARPMSLNDAERILLDSGVGRNNDNFSLCGDLTVVVVTATDESLEPGYLPFWAVSLSIFNWRFYDSFRLAQWRFLNNAFNALNDPFVANGFMIQAMWTTMVTSNTWAHDECGEFANAAGLCEPEVQEDWETLTECEKNLLTSNGNAFKIPTLYTNRNLALNTTAAFFPNEGTCCLHNGRGDAFRHGLFSALNAYTLGQQFAIDLGTCHEDFPTNPPDERAMDLDNNQFGYSFEGSFMTNNNLSLSENREALILAYVDAFAYACQNGGITVIDNCCGSC